MNPILLGVIIWYLFGVITFLSTEKIVSKQVTVGNLLFSFLVGILGPILLLTVLITMLEESNFFDKKVF